MREQDTREVTQTQTKKNKYGNMLVLSDRCCLISFGPDYCCFFPTFAIFFIASFFVIRMVLTSTQNLMFMVSSIVICGGACLSYLAVAISNPGVVTSSQDEEDEKQLLNEDQDKPKKRRCKKCNIVTKRGTIHCKDCDVCIEGYDHHCPWTSKCIGRGNVIQFYVFLTMVPIFLVYIFVSFSVIMSIALNEATKRHIRHY